MNIKRLAFPSVDQKLAAGKPVSAKALAITKSNFEHQDEINEDYFTFSEAIHLALTSCVTAATKKKSATAKKKAAPKAAPETAPTV